MLRSWWLALPVCLMLAILPALGQVKDKPEKDKSEAVKDKDAKDKDAKDKDAKDKDAKDKDAKDKDKKDDKPADKKDDKDKKDKDKGDKEPPKSDPNVVDLEWGFKENKTFYQKMTTTTEQSLTVSNNKVEQKQKQTFYFSWTPLKKADNGDWTIKQKIEGVVMDIDIGNQKIQYDSTKTDAAAANNPLAEFFKELVGSEFTITLDKDLHVTKLEGRDAFLAKLTRANPQMKPLLEQILSEAAMKAMAEPTFAAIPNKQKKKGDSWTKDTNLDMGPIGKYENSYKYTFDGPDDKEKKLAKIKVETTLKYKDAGDAAGANLPFRIKSADLKSTSASGTILYDPELKLIVKTTMDLKLKGELTIDIGGQPTKVELDQTQTSTVDTTEKDPLKKT